MLGEAREEPAGDEAIALAWLNEGTRGGGGARRGSLRVSRCASVHKLHEAMKRTETATTKIKQFTATFPTGADAAGAAPALLAGVLGGPLLGEVGGGP